MTDNPHQAGVSPPIAGKTAQGTDSADSKTHTPGPWLVCPFRARVIVPDRDAPICELLWPTDLRSEDETFANARLIAAAPDLLAALNDVLDSSGARGTYHALKYADAIERAEAAIARATS